MEEERVCCGNQMMILEGAELLTLPVASCGEEVDQGTAPPLEE